MDNRISFTARSNEYVAITKRVWNSAIPDTAYKQIYANREKFEKFARKNNLKITFTDGNNMLPELHTGGESRFLSGKLAMEVEKKPSLASKVREVFSNILNRKAVKNDKPKMTVSAVSYFEKDSQNIPTLKERGKVGFFVDYEPTENHMDKQINLDTVVDFLQKVVGKK